MSLVKQVTFIIAVSVVENDLISNAKIRDFGSLKYLMPELSGFQPCFLRII